MESTLKPLVEIVIFNNALFKSAFGDVSELESEKAPAPGLNSLKWTLGHVTTGRALISELAGSKDALPFDGVFLASTDGKSLPTLPTIAATFEEITPALMRRLALLDAKKLSTAPSSPFPTAEKTTLAAIAFLLQHESYHLGQTSYIRRFLGKTGLIERLLST